MSHSTFNGATTRVAGRSRFVSALSRFIVVPLLLFAVAPLFAAEEIGWKEVELVGAQGVPKGKVHRYEFRGVLLVSKFSSSGGFSLSKGGFYSSTHSANYALWVEALGTYDTHTKSAIERINFSGDMTGTIYTEIKCNVDPWLHHERHGAVIKVLLNSAAGPTPPRLDAVIKSTRQPLTIWGANFAEAVRLSAQAAKHQAPPPPPPPAPDKVKYILSQIKAGKNVSANGKLVPLILASANSSPKAGHRNMQAARPHVKLNPQPEPPIWSGQLTVDQFRKLYATVLSKFGRDQQMKMKVELFSFKPLTPAQRRALREELQRLGLKR